MKGNVCYLYALLFTAVCAAVLLFLYQFTVPPEPMRYILWDSSLRIWPDGTEEPGNFETYIPPAEGDDCTYRFSVALPEDLGKGYLLFETSGLSLTLLLDDAEIYASTVPSLAEIVDLAQAHVPLPAEAAGRTLTALCRPLGGNALFPPLLRHTDDMSREADVIAYANLSGIPAGALAFATLLVCGLFLLGLAWRKPDWSLIALALAALGLTLHPIATAFGFYYLPAWLNELLVRDESYLLISLALAVYLFMNRRRDFWRLFGHIALGSGAMLLLFYLVSLGRGSYLARYIHVMANELFQYGIYAGPAYWLAFWMVAVCAVISAYTLTRSIVRMLSDAQALAMREQLSAESYRQMEKKLRETAAMRHEANHQLTALEALYRQGDLAGLGEMLAGLTKRAAAGQPIAFSENFTLNAILQNAAAQAAEAGVRFEAVALTPKDLRVPEGDLCGLVMNMLDNALEAARKPAAPDKRFIRFRAALNGNFLAIRCENSCEGVPKFNEKGWPQTTKAAPELHGFGMRQMREVAEKYGSILDFSYSDGSFTVQTALCLPEA